MRKLFILVLVFGFFAATSPASAKLLFYDDCEDAWREGTDWLSAGNSGGNSISVSSEQKRAGNKSYKFVLAKYGTGDSETNVELVLRGLESPVQIKNFIYGKEYWIGYSIYYPSNFDFPNDDNNYGCNTQFHATNDSCDYRPIVQPLFFGLNRDTGGYKITTAYSSAACSKKAYDGRGDFITPAFKKGSWNDIVMHLKFNYTGSAITQVWLNGKLVANSTSPNCKNDDMGPYMKIGYYGWTDVTTAIYYDEIRVGDANSSYAEVAPKDSAQPSSSASSTLDPPTLEVVPQN